MSIQAVAWVLDTPVEDLPPIPCMMMIALANHADHTDGRCWPSIATIAAESGYCTRTIDRYIPKLEFNGFVEATQRRGKSGRQRTSNYRLLMDRARGTPWREMPENPTTPSMAMRTVLPVISNWSFPGTWELGCMPQMAHGNLMFR
jgi:hypothetical protein